MVTINKVLGPNGTKLANGFISDTLKADTATKSPKYTVANFTGINDPGQSFFLDNGNVAIIMDNEQIKEAGVPFATFIIPEANVSDVVVPSSKYVEKNGKIYVPLKTTAVGLGFAVAWDGKTCTITLTSDAKVNDNSLVVNSDVAKTQHGDTTLDGKVYVTNGVSYVPLSYFETVLGSCYDVNPDGFVTISTLK